jgi:Uma2 family endonuclease
LAATVAETKRVVYRFSGGEPIEIPAGIVDLESFRQWARSDAFPTRGKLTWCGGVLWVDTQMEQLFSHNLVKAEVAFVLTGLVRAERLGYLCIDRMRFSHPDHDVSSEPDVMFIAYDTLRSGRIREIPPADGEGCIELEGTPNMVLEVVSASSVPKDTEQLREFYYAAGVPEYWLIDVRHEPLQFDILHRGRGRYAVTRGRDGWRHSTVFGRSFRMVAGTDPLGRPQFTLEVQAP